MFCSIVSFCLVVEMAVFVAAAQQLNVEVLPSERDGVIYHPQFAARITEFDDEDALVLLKKKMKQPLLIK